MLRKLNASHQARLLRLLWDGGYTCSELAEQTGLHYVTVLEYTRELRREGVAHISQWQADSRGRAIIKIYKLGPGRDAKRPKRLTSAERQARHRTKVRQAQQMQVLAGRARYEQSANGRIRFVQGGMECRRSSHEERHEDRC